MAVATTLETIPNPDLVVVEDDKPNWNLPKTRRRGFHNLYQVGRYGMSIRAPNILPLSDAIDRRIETLPSVRRLTTTSIFSAMAVVQNQAVLFEAYAPDFDRNQPHSIQSISKTAMNLIIGRLVEEGSVELNQTVDQYIPEIGSGYARATVQQVLDMNVMNNFNEDYEDSYTSDPRPGATVGYNRQEISMGWRLPPAGEPEFSCRDFVAALISDDVSNPTEDMQYRSPNTDVLGWIAERVTGQSLRDLLIDVVEGAGIEGVYHMSTDRDGVPVVSGGACMTARDLARYGLLFARLGLGVNGEAVGSAWFLQETRNDRGTHVTETHDWVRYSNQTYTNGRWLGHPGFAGQFLMADPDSCTAVAFFSVLETQQAQDDDYSAEIVRMAEDVVALYSA